MRALRSRRNLLFHARWDARVPEDWLSTAVSFGQVPVKICFSLSDIHPNNRIGGNTSCRINVSGTRRRKAKLVSKTGKLHRFWLHEKDLPVESKWFVSCHTSLKQWCMSSLMFTCHLHFRLQNVSFTTIDKRLSEGSVKMNHNKPFNLQESNSENLLFWEILFKVCIS